MSNRYPEGEGPEDYRCTTCGGDTVLTSLNPCDCPADGERGAFVQPEFGFIAEVPAPAEPMSWSDYFLTANGYPKEGA